ncbi:FAD-binding oxidoreductase [Cognatishimia sp. WU-CL00825]|uniref:NAD(P)/FAD-dependent oxidoreductase n=1 Tax=Cognatishimia sp. WU-CL00825 TaxID=3127658 RepID=UPI0031073B33
MTQTVTIVGAGLVGICTAITLAERNLSVRLIDKEAPGLGASFGNAGIISPWSVLPQPLPGIWKNIPRLVFGRHRVLKPHISQWPKLIPWGLSFLRQTSVDRVQKSAQAMFHLCEPSIELYRQLLVGTGHEDLIQDAWYVHAFRNETTARQWDETAIDYRLRREFGADIEFASSDTLREIEPSLGTDFKAAVLIKGQARARAPGKIAQALFDKAQTMGVIFHQAEMKSLKREGDGWKIHCKTQSFASDKIVLAAGAWSAKLLEPMGIKLPLMAERGYHVEFADPGVSLNNSVMDMDAKIVASSMADGLRVAGASEFCNIDAPADPKRADLMTRQSRVILPDLDVTKRTLWFGHRPSFPDSLPMLDEFKQQPGLFAAFGHSHYGLMMAPKSGQIVADLIEGRNSNVDLTRFASDRFQ